MNLLQRRDLDWVWGLLLILFMVGGVLVYWYYKPEAVPALVRERFPELPAKPTVKLYKWQDEQGRWHVGDTPPKDRPYQAMTYRLDVNVIPVNPEKEGNDR